MIVGVLALQGAFIEHEQMLRNWAQTLLNLEKKKICNMSRMH